ncbi:hypothetical protein TVAG_494910 [Trichomonas vaginalis G3]|uniref:receptor protein-tyrosine kinase n=1 Tax=Trichomonas vaginalis (strain ATCC PRA-98 / G3) TaxID=412133 RepID=A2EXT8_TRIV3|nr:glycine-rich protein family [Trichomonas vaginalis G3]EAY02542.1 hypothetical protein TVAG_494910 [Trichomonas vaginalis G3]KAI5506034.1 glycine-rich protein family [Trichomonas vaginalis G3]|eukprot:XP_001314781.1 hypothetical protein [Trichomonas vaginalis G3]
MDQWQLGNPSTGTNNVNFNGTVAEFTYPCSSTYDCTYYYTKLPAGIYKVEVWGAQGGGSFSNSATIIPAKGMGGYSVGVMKLDSESTVYVYVGGRGQDPNSPSTYTARGGFNGGGDSPQDTVDVSSNYDDAGGGGESASDIRVGNTNFESRIIVAGGAGGNGRLVNSYSDTGFSGGLEAGRPRDGSGNYGTAASQTTGNALGQGQTGIRCVNAYSGGGGGGYFGGFTKGSTRSDPVIAGGGSGYIGGVISYRDIIAQTIGGNETITKMDGTQRTGNNGNGAARITILGYFLNPHTNLSEYYYPETSFSMEFSVNSLGTGEKGTLNRTFSSNESAEIHSFDDKGREHRFTDNFLLPKKSGYYTISYTITSKSGTKSETSFTILVNKEPKLTLKSEPKDKYIRGEKITLYFDIFDDTFATIYIGDNYFNYTNKTVICNNKINSTFINVEIPFGYTPGHSNRLSIYAIDEYNISSNIYSFPFTIVTNRSPDINVSNNLSYILQERDDFSIIGHYRDLDFNGNVAIYTSIDNTNVYHHQTYPVVNDQWNEFHITRTIFQQTNNGIHYLKIYAVDDKNCESNKFVHAFAYSSELNCKHVSNVLPCMNMRYAMFLIIVMTTRSTFKIK